jgi:alanine dehydrogenase
MELLSLGVLARSHKENEWRLPIHPWRVAELEPDLRERLVLEQGYGERFGMPDAELAGLVSAIRSREAIQRECDVVLLPKPLAVDLREMREGQVLWGWPHCVQDPELTQVAIDGRLTVIAWEAMNHWSSEGGYDLHVFHKNNELAGYCSVMHAMQVLGRTGEYGRRLSAAVIGFGATGRGAVTALMALGIVDVAVLTRREASAVAAPIHSVRWITWGRDPDHADVAVELDSVHETVAHLLAEHDIVVNCVLQDTDAPLVFVHHEDLPRFRRGTLFVDVSCDEGMGFEWARPTSFVQPTFPLGDGLTYYAVDHSPSLLWDSATWEIGEALNPHLRTVLEGPPGWERDETIRRAIEIRDGVIQNPKILSFQRRAPEYPHAVSDSDP